MITYATCDKTSAWSDGAYDLADRKRYPMSDILFHDLARFATS